MLERWAAAAWTSGAGAVGCKGAVGGEESDGRSGGVGVELVKARRAVEVVESRRADRGGGKPTVGGRAIVRTRLGIGIQDRGLASCASCGPRGIVMGADSVGCEGRLRGDRVRAGRAVICLGGIGAR